MFDVVLSDAVVASDQTLKTKYSIESYSVFTDKGPIAKPTLVMQSGQGVAFSTSSEVTLTGGTFNISHLGLYIQIGTQGLSPTTSSSVLGTDVTVTDSLYVADSVKVEKGSTVAYTTPSGTYKILGIVSPTRLRLQASFALPEPATGLYWALVNLRNGEIADDPSDVTVRINDVTVTPTAVVGLLGQIVLPFIPETDDIVEVDYSWCCNPTVEIRRLNSKEFRLNSQPISATPIQHKYQFRNVLVTPLNYALTSILAKLDQPVLRELHYRAYERAYTPVLNDPTLLTLNSPQHKIAYPSSRRIVSEEFVTYEGDALPETDDWTKHGTGTAATLAGVLSVTASAAGTFPAGQAIFWTHNIDLSFPHAFALSWRFYVESVAVYDGVFSGLAAGYADEEAAYVVGFLSEGGVKKIGFLKRAFGDDPSQVSAWIGGLDSSDNPTGAPAEFDWSILHSYRVFRDKNGVVRLFVDGDVVETLRIQSSDAPFLEEVNAPFDKIQGVFFGSILRPTESVSHWDFVRYLTLPTNPLQTAPSSFVDYDATVLPEVASSPWTPVGYHGTETLLAGDFLLLDSTSATDVATASEVGLVGGDFRGFVRLDPLLTISSQVVVDAAVQLRTLTHGLDPYGLMFAVDDGTRLMQVAFLAHQSVPKFSYGGRSFPEDFSPYVWGSLGGVPVEMAGRALRITDDSVTDGKVYFIEDLEPVASDARIITGNFIFEFRTKVISYTADGSGFAGTFGQVYDGTRAIGIMFEEIAGTKYVSFHSDGVPLGAPYRFAFDWGDSLFHTYRVTRVSIGSLASLFIDGVFVGSADISLFTISIGGTPQASFGSSTPSSSASLSTVEWAYFNCWRVRSDSKHYVGIWKGTETGTLRDYHLPTKATGTNAATTGSSLTDSQADFVTALVAPGDLIIVDVGPNQGVYEVNSVGGAQTLDITGVWPLGPTLTSYRIVKETDWATLHKYRLLRDPSGQVILGFESDASPLIQIGYNSLDLPASGSGIVTTLSGGLPAIVFGSFSAENLEQSYWDYLHYGVLRTPTEIQIAPHHQVLNQWNVMESPERLFTALPHEVTGFKSSSTGIVPKKDPDFLADPGLAAFTQLNEDTPLVPSTQSFEVRGPYSAQVAVGSLSTPEDVLDLTADFSVNNGSVRYTLDVPEDVLYSALDVIEQTTGVESLIAPFGEGCGPELGGFSYEDIYTIPSPPDPPVLYTYRPGITSVIGGSSVTWATPERLGMSHMTLGQSGTETLDGYDEVYPLGALIEPVDITRAGFLNDSRWTLFTPANPATNFIAADNSTPIGPGPSVYPWGQLFDRSGADSVSVSDGVDVYSSPTDLPLFVDNLVGWWRSDQGVTLSSASVSNDTAATWVPAGAAPTRTLNQTDPAGGTSAIKLTDTVDGAPAVHYIAASPTNLIDGPHLFEFWAKAGTLNFIRIRYGGTVSAIYIDLQNAIVSEVSSGAVRGTLLSGIAGGWQKWRVEFSTTSAITTITMQMAQTGTGAGSNYQGDGTGTVFIGTGATYGPKLYQDRVSQWNDQSGNGYNGTQATAASQMLYQELDGSSLWVPTGTGTAKRIGWSADAGKTLLLPGGVATTFSGNHLPMTIIEIVNRHQTMSASFNQGLTLTGSGTQIEQLDRVLSTSKIDSPIRDDGGTLAEVASTNSTTATLASRAIVYTGTQINYYLDGVADSGNPKTLNVSIITLANASLQCRGQTYREYAVYNRALSAAEVKQVTNGMRARQGLSLIP